MVRLVFESTVYYIICNSKSEGVYFPGRPGSLEFGPDLSSGDTHELHGTMVVVAVFNLIGD